MIRVHVSFSVSNLERSIAFYEAAFAHSADKRKDDYANFRLTEPPLMLSLVQASGQPRTDPARHYGVELATADDLARWRDRTEAAGLAQRVEKDAVCCYARADKFWLRDPDGNSWEFWVRKDDADSMFEPARPTADRPAERSACCK